MARQTNRRATNVDSRGGLSATRERIAKLEQGEKEQSL